MKGKMLNKARLAAAVMLATAGLAAGTAQADSVLAPLVIHDDAGANAGTHTYFAFKMRGQGIPDAFNSVGFFNNLSPIHYYYIQKMKGMHGDPNALDPVTGVTDLHTYAARGGCHIQNNSGNGTSWDMVIQRAHAPAGAIFDQSQPNGWNPRAGDFYGMMIIDDTANLPANNPGPLPSGRRQDEGELSGFAYIINAAQGLMLDYKLINNHLTKESGDFSAEYISKQSVDWMWLPATNNRTPNPIPNFEERTTWYSVVTGRGMSNKAEIKPGSRWDEVATFTQQPRTGGQDIQQEITMKNSIPGSGAYNNDEDVISGDKDFKIKCLGLYDRSDFLTSLQLPQTDNGGWKPVHINTTNGMGADSTTDSTPDVYGHGALTYRIDDVNGFFTGTEQDIGFSMQVETSGHRSTGKFGTHPNRGY